MIRKIASALLERPYLHCIMAHFEKDAYVKVMKCLFYFRLAGRRGSHSDLLREYIGVTGDIVTSLDDPANLAQCASYESAMQYIAEHQHLYPDKKIQRMRFQPDEVINP